MAKKEEKKTEGKALTRAQKTEATRQIVREALAKAPTKHNELIDEVANAYVLRHGEEGENLNDVKGRVGSVLDIMKKNSEVMYDGGTYALKARMMTPPVEEQPVKKKRGRAKKAETKGEEPATETKIEPTPAEKVEEKPAKRARAKKAQVEEKQEEKAAPAPKTEPVIAEAPPVVAKEEKPTPKKRGRKPKAAAEKAEPVKEEKAPEEKVEKVATVEPVKEPVAPPPVEEPKKEERVEAPKEEPVALVEKPKAEVAKKGVVMDMSFLFGEPKGAKKPQPVPAKPVESVKENAAPKTEEKKPTAKVEEKKAAPVKPAPKGEEKKPTPKVEEKKPAQRTERRAQTKGKETALTPDEKLKESFLKKIRSLGGDYFEYYSIYLLERYSIRNGRRLEGLRISGGDHDGGIDGELELTDTLGFKETIYIQSKNWDPDKGKEDKWVVGETLLQQFIGACACRQAKDGKLHARGIFITTSRFTPEAKRILEDMGDKIVGYDGSDLYEAAKECEFGLMKKNGEWSLDERLLSGTKAFFQMWL